MRVARPIQPAPREQIGQTFQTFADLGTAFFQARHDARCAQNAADVEMARNLRRSRALRTER